MKRLLNTLYVTTDGSYLSKEGETVHVRRDGETLLRVPIHTLGNIVCMGYVTCSPALMGLCGERGVNLAFFTPRGRFLARVQGPVNGNVLLRREQYRRADDPRHAAAFARAVVIGKLANARTVLMRAARESSSAASKSSLQDSAQRLARLLNRLDNEGLPLDTVRGIEGDGARNYFAAFDHLIVAQKQGFFFTERSRRPPLDNMNALLSFIYTLLVHDVVGALEGVGLDPAVGSLHRDRPGRPGLALDLMEEFRAAIADRLALTLVNRRQVTDRGFTTSESGAVTMDDKTRKTVLVAYQERKQEEVTHPYLNERVRIGLLPHVQAMLLSRHLRNELDGYPPFIWK